MPQTRQLAVIMFTDIVGYTSLMGDDEQKALEILSNNRSLQSPVIEKNNGKFIKEMGDGILASFNSVTEAINAAKEIIEKCNIEKRFQLRIGLHLGEVVLDNNDVFGDGVNVASRIQAAAKPDSIYMSETVYLNIVNKKDIETRFVKEDQLKNVKVPVKIHEVVNSSKENPNRYNGEQVSSRQMKSIAVMPFVNMSNDTEQDYFCDGVSEEILNTLGHLNNLRVISRTSSFALKNKNLDAREIGKLLDVQSLLEGNVRKAGNRLRITTNLINANDGAHLWSDRYDRDLEDIFSIQEDIATNVATALKGFLTSKEKQDIHRPEINIEAYEYFLRGREFFHRLNHAEAIKSFKKAIELDTGYALAYAGIANVYAWRYEWEGSKREDLQEAKKNSFTALSLDPNLPESHISRGFVLSQSKNYAEAEKEFTQALVLNPQSFDAYYIYGRILFAQGDIEKSAEMFGKASSIRLDDYQSVVMQAQSIKVLGLDYTHYLVEGVARARRQLLLKPDDARILSLVSCNLYEIGQKDEAFAWMEKALALYPEDAGVLLNATCLFAKAKEKDKALNILEKAIDRGYGKKDWIEHDPDYDNIRNEQRFKELLARL
jgi:adenylate cyclase